MSTTAAEGVKQDMPPKGGYRKIHVDRVFPKPFASSKLMLNIVNHAILRSARIEIILVGDAIK